MAIANPRIHIICGICGNGDTKLFSYKIVESPDDDDSTLLKKDVYISCKNCSSLTGLDELIKEKK